MDLNMHSSVIRRCSNNQYHWNISTAETEKQASQPTTKDIISCALQFGFTFWICSDNTMLFIDFPFSGSYTRLFCLLSAAHISFRLHVCDVSNNH